MSINKLLVLFVHGLGGGRETWGDFKEILENDEEIRDKIEVKYFNYPTKIFKFWFFPWKSLRIQDIAQGLSTEIKHRYPQFENILLVCHSMGGLVAKCYVVEKIKKNKKNLNVRGLVFFSTPHSGSEFAKACDILSRKHYQVKQLRKDSDFIDFVTRDFRTQNCDTLIDTTYVVAGQDNIVSRDSSGLGHSQNIELIADKGHINIVKPLNKNELSYLIVKQNIKKHINAICKNNDLVELKNAIDADNKKAIQTLIVNKGRSWIESEEVEDALVLLEEVYLKYEERSISVIWSKYLVTIARLFRFRETSTIIFDANLMNYASEIGIESLFLAETMEFSIKKGDLSQALDIAKELFVHLSQAKPANNAIISYSIATAFFLLGSFFRYGGRYTIAKKYIEKAKQNYNPAILAHQIEIAHCQYTAIVCHVMSGELVSEKIKKLIMVAPEFRLFSEALIILTESHMAWSFGRLGEAVDKASRAGQVFGSIGYHSYSSRALKLKGLLECWQHLEFGATHDIAVAKAPEYSAVIRGMLGDRTARDSLLRFISNTKPAQVLGILQFAIAYNNDAMENFGLINLPPTLKITTTGGNLICEWINNTANSLAEAEKMLRNQMEIDSNVRIPLFV